MKLIYAVVPLCLFSACKQSPTQADDGQVSPAPSASAAVKNPSQKPESKPEEVSKAKPADPKESKPKVKPMGDDRYLGMTKEAAAALAKKEGVPSRIVSEDGKVRMVTMDHRPDRLNFTVVAGKVTKVTRG